MSLEFSCCERVVYAGHDENCPNYDPEHPPCTCSAHGPEEHYFCTPRCPCGGSDE